MKIKERLVSFLIAFAVTFSFIPLMRVQAETVSDVNIESTTEKKTDMVSDVNAESESSAEVKEDIISNINVESIADVKADILLDINIVSTTEVTAEQVKKWAKSKGATDTFVNLADLYFKYSKECGNVNPAIAYVQAAKETGYGKFGGVLNETYFNPCGMKTSSGGGDYDPDAHQRFNSWDEGVQAHLDHLALYAGAKGYPKSNTYDPRHFVTIKGKATTVNSLGGKWAPSATYGEDINKLYRDLLKSSGVSVGDEEIEDSDNSNNNSGNNGSNETVKPEPPKDTVAPQAPPVNKPVEIKVDTTTNISSTIGWKLEGGKWYYYRSDGSKATGWIKPGADWYYLYSDGVMATGWINSSSSWYYLQSSGAMKLGWLKDGGKWYYLQGGGSMVTGFNLIDGKTYFLDTSGAMRIGWFKISNQWYYFNSDGSMVSGWIKPDGNWYYLFSNGIMATGWLARNGEMYHLASSGAMSTGWVSDGGSYYYLNPSSGIMAKSTTIDGWEIGTDGKRGNKVSGGSSKLIVIDPGHNFGGDDGAYATHNGVTYCERDLNMEVALKLKTKLESYGYQVMMTRNEFDRETLAMSQSLANRVNMANNFGADFFISLHHNSASTSSAYGVETYYSTKAQDSAFGGAYSDSKISTSRSMASKINNAIVNKTGQYNRGAKDGNLYVCRNTKMPSVLVEFGFLSNPDEAAKCATWTNQNLAATGIAETIYNAF